MLGNNGIRRIVFQSFYEQNIILFQEGSLRTTICIRIVIDTCRTFRFLNTAPASAYGVGLCRVALCRNSRKAYLSGLRDKIQASAHQSNRVYVTNLSKVGQTLGRWAVYRSTSLSVEPNLTD